MTYLSTDLDKKNTFSEFFCTHFAILVLEKWPKLAKKGQKQKKMGEHGPKLANTQTDCINQGISHNNRQFMTFTNFYYIVYF